LLIHDDLTPENWASCVLLVDDEASIRELLSIYLENAGYKVLNAANGIEAIVKLRDTLPSVIISDLEMSRMSGFELIAVVRRRYPTLPIIVLTASIAGEFPAEAKPDYLLEKNVHGIPDVLQVVNDLARHKTASANHPQAAVPPARPQPGLAGFFILTCTDCLRKFEAKITPGNEAMAGTVVCEYCEARVPYSFEHSKAE
jgi:CheY-like chemotaxis protein